jgi:proteasome lid subunit RPN8/RPN11
MDKFSDSYEHNITDEVAIKIRSQLHQYNLPIFGEDMVFVTTPAKTIGVLAKIRVDAGSDSKLRTNEPIVIAFSSIENIEKATISVYPDRKDFPFEDFPHINYPREGMPPSLCLTREDFDDWYSEHTFGELVRTISNWFVDAQNGNLIKLKDGDYYEPFRTNLSKAILLKSKVDDTHLSKYNKAGFLVRSIYTVDKELDFYTDVKNGEAIGICILLYRSAKNILRTWFVNKPSTYGELKQFLSDYEFVFNEQEIKERAKNRYNISHNIEKIFFQIAFTRPRKVLNKHTNVDYLYFCVDNNDIATMCDKAPVHEATALDSTTNEFAQYLSATSPSIGNKRILILGCGAIGSKIIYHLYRSGICNLTICDKDSLMPHNVCRHALSQQWNLNYKAEAVKRELNRMFVSSPSIVAVTEDINSWLPSQNLNAFDLIIEATASAKVLHTVEEMSLKTKTPIVHFALSDAGNIGIVYVNYNRNCLLTDYYMNILICAANGDEDLIPWLKSEVKYNYENIRIGEGCHSNTMILSDDVISTHSGIASMVIRDMFDSPGKKKNAAYLSFTNIEYKGDVFSKSFDMPNFISFDCDNDSSWKVRIPSNIAMEIKHIAKVTKPREAGGYLMGTVETKRKTIYILDHFETRSVSGNTQIALGTDGWEQHYKTIQERTNHTLTYIGDWHSHPVGSLKQSNTDKLTNKIILEEEIESKFGICMITNGKNTKFYLLAPNVD